MGYSNGRNNERPSRDHVTNRRTNEWPSTHHVKKAEENKQNKSQSQNTENQSSYSVGQGQTIHNLSIHSTSQVQNTSNLSSHSQVNDNLEVFTHVSEPENDTQLKDAEDLEHHRSRLTEENETLRQTTTCKICLDKPVDTVFLPCRHLICCEECADRVKQCPFCRTQILGTVHTFMDQ